LRSRLEKKQFVVKALTAVLGFGLNFKTGTYCWFTCFALCKSNEIC